MNYFKLLEREATVGNRRGVMEKKSRLRILA